MKIQINSQRENDDDITVFWTLTDDSNQEYPWHSDVPKGVDLQAYLTAKMPEYLLLIRRREYPALVRNRDYVIEGELTELEAIDEWVKDGQMLRNDEGEYTEKLDPQPLASTHPGPTAEDRIAGLEDRVKALEA